MAVKKTKPNRNRPKKTELWTKRKIERGKENRVYNYFVTREDEPSRFLYLQALQVQKATNQKDNI
jgi:hypothetical protein